ncbi:MAG: FMN-binding glutamate synthase family protein, partial [Planctomycetota bacterium]
RPEIRQYFIEDDLDGRPFNREQRSLVYQRSKGDKDYDPFGSELDARSVGYEWIAHSISPVLDKVAPPKVRVGGPHCSQPYEISLFNVSAMSFGSLGPSAVRAMGRGAKEAGFGHNTGEGGVSRYHLETGADLVWQIGTGYFGCRAKDGTFSEERFREQAAHDHVKMIELKLSQGAKPGHGGILPGHKVTPEIAEARGVEVGEACLSPSGHSAFSTPAELVAFVDRLREGSGGKPVGIKLCIGLPHEFLAVVKAMVESGSGPDFITVDGGEGGTGAAPPEFGDHVGMPLEEGLVFARNAIRGAGLGDRVTIAASGKVISAMDILRCIALGASYTCAARAFMLSVGCIQAQLCHTNECPVGVATLDPLRNRGLDPKLKGARVARYHRDTLHSLMELVAATGWRSPHDVPLHSIQRRVDVDEVRALEDLYPREAEGALLSGSAERTLQAAFDRAQATSFAPAAPATGS